MKVRFIKCYPTRTLIKEFEEVEQKEANVLKKFEKLS